MEIINSIAPVFFLILLGKILDNLNFFPHSFLEELNRFVYYIALPSLLISSTSTAPFSFSSTSNMVTLFTLGTLGSLTVAWLTSYFLKLPAPKAGSFIQGSFRGNGIFVGLPIIIYTLGTVAEQDASIMLAPIVIIFNVVAVAVLIKCGKLNETKNKPVFYILKSLFKNPMIVSCLIGIFLNIVNFKIPSMIYRPMDILGDASLPLILISIGASLELKGLKDTAAPTIIGSIFKVVLTPVCGLLLMNFFELTEMQKMITIIFLGVPTAGTSYVLAEELGCDGPLSARIVALSTLLSALTLPWLISLNL